MNDSDVCRLRIDIAYDGSRFHGWAFQPGLRTVEGEVQDAISKVVHKRVHITVGGRTDAGVHARNNTFHVDVPSAYIEEFEKKVKDPYGTLKHSVNAILMYTSEAGPYGTCDVVIRSVKPTHPQFDARFSALNREYTYRVADNSESFMPTRRTDILWFYHSLHIDEMNRAASFLEGEHDFLSFCRPREGATTIRTLEKLFVERDDEGNVCIHAQADAFCHSMVRTLVGTLLYVGRGMRPALWAKMRLEQRERNGEVIVAPAHPLTLERINYPETQAEQIQQITKTKRKRVLCEDER